MNGLFTNKVFYGILLTFVIGGLTALGTVNPGWGGTITAIVALLTAVGHSSNIVSAA